MQIVNKITWIWKIYLLQSALEKGDGLLGSIAERLMEELECKTVFTIPLFGGIGVSESVVVTWIIMAVLILIAFILTRNLKIKNSNQNKLLGGLKTWI